MNKHFNLDELAAVVARLRDPQTGCAWDLAQTPQSLIKYTLEEVHELLHAISELTTPNLSEAQQATAICEELGDVLFHLLFYAQMADEQQQFDFQVVINKVAAKMIYRHPHIFAGKHYQSLSEQLADWEQLKATEQTSMSTNPTAELSVFDSHLGSLPAILQSLSLQNSLAKLGFDWSEAAPVIDKVKEELAELQQAIQQGNPQATQAEFGDLLFTCLNLSRQLDIDPDLALRQANQKFQRRAEQMFALAGGQSSFKTQDLTAQDALWNAVKVIEAKITNQTEQTNIYSANAVITD